MFNLGMMEVLALCGLALIVIGPRQLPDVARAVARLINECKRVKRDVTKTFYRPEKKDSLQSVIEDVKKAAPSNFKEDSKRDTVIHE